MAASPAHPKAPLHGLTLEALLGALVATYGWPGLGERIPLRCFTHDPSLGSSLKFLRRTPWAREKVESLYLFMRRDARRQTGRNGPDGPAGQHAPNGSNAPDAPNAPNGSNDQ